MHFLLRYCSCGSKLLVSAQRNISCPSFLLLKLKSASSRQIVLSLETWLPFCFFSSMTLIDFFHLVGDRPVAYGMCARVASNAERNGEVEQAFIWPKCMPEMPEEVRSFIFDHPFWKSDVVIVADGG